MAKFNQNLPVTVALSGNNIGVGQVLGYASPEWQSFSGILSNLKTNKRFMIGTRTYAIVGLIQEYRNMMLINITKIFGPGNEPTKQEMDEIIRITGWFDNEYALTNKQQFIILLNLIRKNTLATTALGGTL